MHRKKVRLQIRIDHKMFDIFTSRNVKKNLKMSDQDQNVRPNSRTERVLTLKFVGHFGWNMSDLSV